MKWAIDPGLDGDVYADRPYLYGPLVSSINTFRVGAKGPDGEGKGEGKGVGEEILGKEGQGMLFEEGGEGDGAAYREGLGVPETDAARKKWFMVEENRKKWEFEQGRSFYGDFFNPYLDFNGAFSFWAFCLCF